VDILQYITELTITASFINGQLITWITGALNCNTSVQTLMSTGIVHFAPKETY